MGIRVENIIKEFGTFRALDDVSVTVPDGELVALVGPSGSGKTTLLRIIAGLEVPDNSTARILFGDDNVTTQSVKDRGIGFVFQHYALFRHMTVFENVAFGLRVRPRRLRPSRADIADRVHELLKLVQLDGLARRFPAQLSGGQRQRVALARALASQPKILLLDEPFGALDAGVRAELRQWLRRLHDEINLTTLFVTHDQEEALELADRVIVMHNGQVEQVGTPGDVFHYPASEFVINFLGNVNLFHGRVENGTAYVNDIEVASLGASANGSANGSARVFVRPHEFTVSLQPHCASIQGTIRRIHAAGPVVRLDILDDNLSQIQAHISQEQYTALHLTAGTKVYITPRSARVFQADYSI